MRIKQEIVDKFKSLEGKVIKKVTADTPEVGLDGDSIYIEFLDGDTIRIQNKIFTKL